ncbi:hypothetical protein JCM11251_006067 [Rhodosporidiobolus azoricus]
MKVRASTYTDSELEYLTWRNLNVQLHWYAGILTMIVVFGLYNWTSRILAALFVRRYNSLHSAKTSSRTGCISGVVAAYRKWTYRRNQLVVWLGTLGKGWADYSAHHAARLTYAHLPILVGLASKDLGAISWLTGFSPATLNAFHRWMARMTCFLAVWHVFGRSIAPSQRGLEYQAAGCIALAMWSIMIIGSGRSIRRRFFKSFFYSHVTCFCVSVIACALHIPRLADPFKDLVASGVIYIRSDHSDEWNKAADAVYALQMADRIVRLVNAVYWSAFRTVTHGVGPSARVEIILKDTIKIFFKTAQKWSPGSHSYLHCPTFEAGGHPFSIASTDLPVSHLDNDPPPRNSTIVLAVRVHTGLTAKLYQHVLDGTEGLVYASSESGNLSVPLFPAFTEGPYGHPFLVHHYVSVLLFTGGSGVTFAMPLMLKLVRRARNKHLGGRKPLITGCCTFVWAIKNSIELGSMADELREAISFAPPGFLDVQVYDTSGKVSSAPTPVSELHYTRSLDSHCKGGGGSSKYGDTSVTSCAQQLGSGYSQETLRPDVQHPTSLDSRFPPPPKTPYSAPPAPITSISDFPSHPSSLPSGGRRHSEDFGRTTSTAVRSADVVIPTLYGRPRVRDILAETVAHTPRCGSVAVGVCGPVHLADDVGAACSDVIDASKVMKGEHRLNAMLHQEVFGW